MMRNACPMDTMIVNAAVRMTLVMLLTERNLSLFAVKSMIASSSGISTPASRMSMNFSSICRKMFFRSMG